MADALGTIMTVIGVVNAAVDVCKKIQDCPEQMQVIGESMARLSLRLTRVKTFVQKQQIDQDSSKDILDIINRIGSDSERIETLFTKYKNDIGPFDLKFRFKTLTAAYYSLGSSAGELETLGKKIDKYLSELDSNMIVLIAMGVNVLVPAGTTAGASGLAEPPSLSSPIPILPRHDYNVVFVDPYNTARSIVAEGYLKLVQDWTVRTGGDWRIALAHSSGLFVRNRGAHNAVIEGMQYRHPSYKLNMAEGGKHPEPTALAALFDNKMFDYPSKAGLKQQMEARFSRGIPKSIFKTYDFILVFTDREYDNLVRLRKTLVGRDGEDAVSGGGKGRVLHLGRYLAVNGVPKEILGPVGHGTRAQWNVKCSEIKTAVKGFLAKEMGWKQPAPGAKLLF